MDAPHAKRVVVSSVIVAAILSEARDLSGQHRFSKPRVLAGLFVVGFVLALVADAQPSIAAAMAVLVATSIALSMGPKPFDALTKALEGFNGALGQSSATITQVNTQNPPDQLK